MLGFTDTDEPAAVDYGLLHSATRPAATSSFLHTHVRKLTAGALAMLAMLAMVGYVSSGSARAPLGAVLLDPSSPLEHDLKPLPHSVQWHGVSLGGWLLMEINPGARTSTSPLDLRPKWMFDQLEAQSELDFVTALRHEHGDAYTIATMKNHWTHYISDAALDDAKSLGVDTVRVPVGYWIMDVPVGGSSPLEYGFSPEGFVTGGLNHLGDMLKRLKARGMDVLLDIHAMPCNSACVSNGLNCAAPLAFMAAGDAPIGPMAKCASGATTGDANPKYETLRVPRPGERTWGDVGINTVEALAKWVAAQPEEAQNIVCFQLANEPALGPSSPAVYAAILAFYQRAIAAARKHLPTTPLVLSFMGPSPAVTRFMTSAGEVDEAAGGGGLLGDHHYYLNWQALGVGPGVPAANAMPWDEIHRRACQLEAEGAAHDVDVYARAKLHVIVGEWSLATNLDAPMDLANEETRQQLIQLYREQIETFRGQPEVRGAFFWTLRMGSGWDPRPFSEHPNGQQVSGTSAWKSLAAYPFKVWSLLELKANGIASRLDLPYVGTCAQNKCKGAVGTCDA
mmetsp:Transcript_22038/g.47472  ORF Transcript_22038/g.47472 Transcript_22038/m.47472 type:complete len:566 (-) Transcript_22038:346-2043(-)|eukprot:CAMPEP_0183337882 /NCGR_PEP_ID=MMETSP0164_2-20130417/5373_1 /TAXON_ID=221442 /ORGANISM="Coccolithus pelagicus ssp braarudi, Strain PLY182g" /LENGTH=565 /DNA_ID=CAMNT_0025507651 /DNA_START=38 /DNA_END=1735 /DNA_ORIENTATION=-